MVFFLVTYPQQAHAEVDSSAPVVTPTNNALPNDAKAQTDLAHSSTDADKLGSEAALSRGLALYDSGQYEECVGGLTDWLKSAGESSARRPEQIDQARIYLGACLIASGRSEQADQVFREAIRNNPQMRAPDGLVFPQTVVDRFLRVREQLLSEIRRDEQSRIVDAENRVKEQDAKRKREVQIQEQLKAMAREEAVVEKNRRWLASVPFGVGQFQNGDNVAGWIFLASEAALAGACFTALVIDEHLANKSREHGINLDELRAKRLDAYRVIFATSWGFLGVAAGGIVHAHWRFVPERRTKRIRSLPPELEQPDAPMPQGRSSSQTHASNAPSIGFSIGPIIGVNGTF